MQRDDWLPIETAPKDGTNIVVYREDGLDLARYDSDKYAKNPNPFWYSWRCAAYRGVRFCRANPPTHWIPLDKPHVNDH